jgi:guanylate kinase
MGKIFYIMGKSSSGKDTIYKELLNSNLGLKTIVLYTTRPKRDTETHGIEYYFSNEEELLETEKSGNLIEVRAYDTIHGIWKYFTVNDDQMNLEENDYLMIGTLVSYEKLKSYYGEDTLIPIYIEVDDGVRLQRALDRERLQEQPRYTEMCRRFLADSEDFSKENIINAGINNFFRNDSLPSCIKEITEYVKRERKRSL